MILLQSLSKGGEMDEEVYLYLGSDRFPLLRRNGLSNRLQEEGKRGDASQDRSSARDRAVSVRN